MVSVVSAVSFRWFCWFRWFRPFRFGGFARFGGFGCFVSVVSVVSVVSAVSFRWFRFVVSGFSTCRQYLPILPTEGILCPVTVGHAIIRWRDFALSKHEFKKFPEYSKIIWPNNS